ncbi:hypothetical protein KIL84_007782 [Mauremys mutica]|uniref:Uncharacterized protein n=1 Tax=Mauremys mutica TaxID=74926 RepID=A0A9D3WY32_9SAUR|nr:hypothetical protein KIL84_007782 [Mauremys mutica]
MRNPLCNLQEHKGDNHHQIATGVLTSIAGCTKMHLGLCNILGCIVLMFSQAAGRKSKTKIKDPDSSQRMSVSVEGGGGNNYYGGSGPDFIGLSKKSHTPSVGIPEEVAVKGASRY